MNLLGHERSNGHLRPGALEIQVRAQLLAGCGIAAFLGGGAAVHLVPASIVCLRSGKHSHGCVLLRFRRSQLRGTLHPSYVKRRLG